MERAIELVTHVGQDGFGVFEKKWLPGFGLLPVLAALKSEVDSRKLGEQPRADLRHWYWCNVFLERYSSAVESKSRKDYLEFMAHWLEGKPTLSVFEEAKARILAEGFTVHESASSASAVYSGIFCLLAMRNARDWKRGESIQLQELQDHHIFPKAYLKRKGLTEKVPVNTILNRTLISDETNGKIKDKAPAEYIASSNIFPSGANAGLLLPHFINEKSINVMKRAGEADSNENVMTAYEEFRKGREAEIIAEIRKVCGLGASSGLS
jgi:hypothetical protein